MIKRYPRHFVNIAPGTWQVIFGLTKSQDNNGSYDIERFEENFARYTGSPYAVSVSSGRGGLFLALKALGLKKTEEVIVSAYNFPIVPLTIKKSGFTPVFVDVDPETYNLDTGSVKKYITPKTKAIIATHLFGQPCDIEELQKICEERGISLIEDCAHSSGAEYKGQRVGSFGDIGLFSFSLPKNMTCFGGGMLTIKRPEVRDNARKIQASFPEVKKSKVVKDVLTGYMTHFFLSPKIFSFFSYPFLRILDLFNVNITDTILNKELEKFYNKDSESLGGRLSSIQARAGLLQLSRIDEVNDRLRNNADFLSRHLRNISRIHLPRAMASSKGVFSYYRILIDNPDRLKRLLLREGVDSQRGNIINCSKLRFFRTKEKDGYPNAEMLSNRGLEIPNNYLMEEIDLLTVCNILKKLYGRGDLR